MIRIVIADDHPIVRGGLTQLMASTSDMQVVGYASNRYDVLLQCQEAAVDVLVLDLSMPGVQGLSLLQEVMALPRKPPVVVLSMHNEGQIVQRAMKMGASAYVTKDSDPLNLLTAIRKVVAGSKYIDPALLESVASSFAGRQAELHDALSQREWQVLHLIMSGRPISDIAAQLHLSPKTISTHKMRIMQKLDVSSTTDLVRYALQHGLN